MLKPRVLFLIGGAGVLFTVGLCWNRGHLAGESPAGHSPAECVPGGSPAHGEPVAAANALDAACRETSDWIARHLGPEFSVIARSPMVLGGDGSEAELDRWHRAVVEPARRAMAAAYFTVAPTEPITILLFRTEQRYRDQAMRLFGDGGVSRFAYYRPHLRTLLVNLEAGPGGLLHELTHALMAFDFPNPPPWLAEGLASLHECVRCENAAPRLEGLVNWRLAVLQEAVERKTLRPLEALVKERDFYGQQERLNYAHARFFCLYLQDRGLLEACYAGCKAGTEADATGSAAIRRLLPGRRWEEIDADFRAWLARKSGPLTSSIHPATRPPWG